MSAETSATHGHITNWRLRFRVWRGSRPFWAGLFVMLSGLPIAYLPYANLQLGHLTLAMATTAGAGSLIIGVLLVVLGLTLWFQYHVRVFAGVAAILLSLVSIPVSNLGGFGMGFLLALVGGALGVSWAPDRAKGSQRGKQRGDGVDDDHLPVDTGAAGPVAPADDLSGTGPAYGANGTNGRHRAG